MREICLETSSLPLHNEKDRRYLTLVYCAPYVLTQTAHCFVAVNADDRVIGYILSAPDFQAFSRTFRTRFLPQIDRLGLRYAFSARLSQTIHFLYRKKFPAHLHIDLSEEARHQGVGTRLMNALKAHLAEEKVRGMVLSCDKKNANALHFYRRNSFRKVCSIFGSVVFTFSFE